MGWASHLIEKLEAGEEVTFHPRGRSMEPTIHSGDQCTVSPLQPGDELQEDDIVLCRVHGAQYLHKIVKCSSSDNFSIYQIGNNKGNINGWTQRKQIFGKLTSIVFTGKKKHEKAAGSG